MIGSRRSPHFVACIVRKIGRGCWITTQKRNPCYPVQKVKAITLEPSEDVSETKRLAALFIQQSDGAR